MSEEERIIKNIINEIRSLKVWSSVNNLTKKEVERNKAINFIINHLSNNFGKRELMWNGISEKPKSKLDDPRLNTPKKRLNQ